MEKAKIKDLDDLSLTSKATPLPYQVKPSPVRAS